MHLRRMALHLVQYLAVFLAETITGLLQRVLTHPARGLVDEMNAALLTQKFWVQAIYTELLCDSSRHLDAPGSGCYEGKKALHTTRFFFLRVPCALEALTVINPLVEIVHSHA